MGANAVARYLNRQGYVKKKRQNGTLETFTAHFIKLVLDNPIYCGKIAFGRRKTKKIQCNRNQYHVVKQDEYPVYDGIHEAIIIEEDWQLAQEKRKKTGSFYRDYWYYACKHRLELDGHKCTYKKQIHQYKINDAVVEIIRHIVRNSKFDTAIKEKLENSVDLETYETEETAVKAHIRQLTAEKDRLGKQIDRLDYSDKHYEEKYNDMQNRMDSLYDEIAEANDSLETVQMQIQGIREQQISQERVYEFLELFDIKNSFKALSKALKYIRNRLEMGRF